MLDTGRGRVVLARVSHALRLAAQGLAGPPLPTPVAVAERLLAVQAQDGRGMRLAVRSRTTGLRAADLEAELERRAVVVTWLNRGTLHLVRREDLPWLHALTLPQLRRTNARRLQQEGVGPGAAERGVAAILHALEDEGPLPVAALRERVTAAGVRSEGQAIVHLLLLATLRGHVVRGPLLPGGAQAHALVHDWLGGPFEPVDRDAALVELARRYLAGHGPATDRDLARWAGITLAAARAGLRGVGGLAELGGGLVDLPGRAPAPPLPPPRLLGAFDPLLLGWVSREDVVPADTPVVVTSNGIFRPVALVEGRAVATWSYAGGAVTLAPFGPLGPAAERALRDDAEDVVRFLSAPA